MVDNLIVSFMFEFYVCGVCGVGFPVSLLTCGCLGGVISWVVFLLAWFGFLLFGFLLWVGWILVWVCIV